MGAQGAGGTPLVLAPRSAEPSPLLSLSISVGTERGRSAGALQGRDSPQRLREPGATILPGAGLPPSCSRWGARRRSAASASAAAGRAGSRGWCSGRAPPASRPAACSPSCPGPAGALGTPGERMGRLLGGPLARFGGSPCAPPPPPAPLTISRVWFHDGHRPLPRSWGRATGWGRLLAGCKREMAAGDGWERGHTSPRCATGAARLSPPGSSA